MIPTDSERSRLQSEIIALRQAIESLSGLPELQPLLREQLAAKIKELSSLEMQTGGLNSGGVNISIGQVGDIVIGSISTGRDISIATNQTILNFFSPTISTECQNLLFGYLNIVIGENQQLRLIRLIGRRSPHDTYDIAPSTRLQEIFTDLVVNGGYKTIYSGRRTAKRLLKLINRVDFTRLSPDHVPPERVRIIEILNAEMVSSSDIDSTKAWLQSLDPDTFVDFRLVRPELALEAIYHHRCLVLTGAPGSGKSTLLQYLAVMLALRLRGINISIPGWREDAYYIPIKIPLAQLASVIKTEEEEPSKVLWQVIGQVLDDPANSRAKLRDCLHHAFEQGNIILLCDGLDEVPVFQDGKNLQKIILDVLYRFSQETNSRIVLTSRTLHYLSGVNWQQLQDDGWVTKSIASWNLGQVASFVSHWYSAIASSGASVSVEEASSRSKDLIESISSNFRLKSLAYSPLLLTTMAILHYNNGRLPLERTILYEEIVTLLLERWEPVRQPGIRRPTLTEQLGLPLMRVQDFRHLTQELAFKSHSRHYSDGRGLISVEDLTRDVSDFLRRYSIDDSQEKVVEFVNWVRNNAGLLVMVSDNHFSFAHLALQEYLAACHIANASDIRLTAYECWGNTDRNRWLEVLLLMIGRFRQRQEENKIPIWLEMLVDEQIGGKLKQKEQHQHDILLASLTFLELDGYTDLFETGFRANLEGRLQFLIVELLNSTEQFVGQIDRITCAEVLGKIGDLRIPVNSIEWLSAVSALENTGFESEQVSASQLRVYFRRINAGHYAIGGWENSNQAGLAISTFWLSRFPVTVSQFAEFVREGYSENAQRWWTPEGWRWKTARQRLHPSHWQDNTYYPNRPVVGVTWYEAAAFVSWLTERLAGILPSDYALRLPTEAEWEIAAAYDNDMQRRIFPWGEEEPGQDKAIYDQPYLTYPAPVGICPSGASGSGVLDMAGNTWEWTSSNFEDYPFRSEMFQYDVVASETLMAVRGGAFYDDNSSIKCSSRHFRSPYLSEKALSFRLVLAPIASSMSTLTGLVWDYLQAAGFEADLMSEPGLFLCRPKDMIWKRYFSDAIAVKVLVDVAIDLDGVIALTKDAERLIGWKPSHVFVIYNRAPTNGAWLQIGAMRDKSVHIIPIDDTVLLRGRQKGRQREELFDYLEERFLGPRRDLYDRQNPISDRLSFFGREQLAHQFSEDMMQGNAVALFGLRKMGKSSLLNFLRNNLPCPVSLVDLQAGVELGSVYQRILDDWARSIRVKFPNLNWKPPLLSNHRDPSSVFTTAVAKLLDQLANKEHIEHLVLFVDEIEWMAPKGRQGLSRYLAFAGALRGVSQERAGHVGLIIAGVDPAIVRTNRIVGQQNPFYNFFREQYLPPLNREDCIQMIRNIGVQMGLSYTDESVSFVAEVSGGHPYWARKLCSLAFQDWQGSGPLTLQDLQAAAQRFVQEPSTTQLLDEHGLWGEITDPHLWPKTQISANEHILLSLAEVERRRKEELLTRTTQQTSYNTSLYELNQRSILGKLEEDQYWIQLRLFRNWIRIDKLGEDSF